MTDSDTSDGEELFTNYGEAAGALVTAALNSLELGQRRLIDQAMQGGAQLVLVTDVEPLSVRGVLKLPGGDIVTVFQVVDGVPVAVH